MEAAGVAAVVAGKDAALGIDLDAESIAAALAEDLELFRLRLITPDRLALDVRNRFLIQPGTRDLRGDGAAVRAIEPAVRPPAQAVGHGVCVLDAETREVDNRIAVGDVVVVLVGIEKEIWRIEHPHAAAPALDGGADVQ